MRSLSLRLILALPLLAVLLAGGPVRAASVVERGDDVPPVSGAPMGEVAVRRGVQGPAGLFTARLSLLIDASKNSFGKPTSFAPDLYYSFTDTVQLGLLHTLPMGWQTLPGAGLCLTGQSNGCPHVYDNVGLDFMYGLVYGDFHLSLHSSLFLVPIADPTGVMWTIGLAGKFHFTNMVALWFDPQVGIMLAHRQHQLHIPFGNGVHRKRLDPLRRGRDGGRQPESGDAREAHGDFHQTRHCSRMRPAARVRDTSSDRSVRVSAGAVAINPRASRHERGRSSP